MSEMSTSLLHDAVRSTVSRLRDAGVRPVPPSASDRLRMARYLPRPLDLVSRDFLADADARAHGYITGGAKGEVFAGSSGSAIKIVEFRPDFVREVHTQQLMRERLLTATDCDIRVPEVHDAFTVTVRGHCYGVLVMERVACSLHDVLFYHHRDRDLMREVVAALKDIVDRLHTVGALHGDLHTGNVGFDAEGRAYLMDFEYSLPYRLEEFEGVDTLCVWRHSLVTGASYASLNAGLREHDFPGSALLAAAFGQARPVAGDSRIDTRDIDERVLFRAMRRIRAAQLRDHPAPDALRHTQRS